MTLIDQRILIDAPTDVVWKLISDSNHLARWHAGYTQVSVLSTLPTGVGARRRCKPVQGKDVIEEITAWVEGLGYEYKIVDGGPYKSFQARIRLQAGPDGTSVQWTVVYQPKGLGGAIKNRLGGKGRLSELIATSLRTLKREIDTIGVHMDDSNRAKVSIQSRMNADQRAQYQRRYAPPEKEAEEGIVPAEGAPVAVPPIPNVPAAPPLAPAPITGPVPSFVSILDTDPPGADNSQIDTEPKAPKGLKEAIAEQAAPPIAPPIIAPPPAPVPAANTPDIPVEDKPFVRPPDQIAPPPAAPSDDTPDYRRQTPPRGIPVVQPSEVVQPPPVPQSPAVEEKKRTPIRDLPAVETPNLPPPTPKTDTGEMSIWEVFGIKRPSERDQAVLNELVREVQTRKRSDLVLEGGFERPARARHLPTVLGLRLRLALEAVRVRLRRSHEDETNG